MMTTEETSEIPPIPRERHRFWLALLVPLAAVLLQLILRSYIHPYGWVLLYPAVFFASRIGGLRAGLTATALSILAAWTLFRPSFALERPAYAILTVVFTCMGVFFSLTHELLRKANRQSAQALAALQAERDRLEETVTERTGDLSLEIEERRRTETALRVSEEQFRTLADSIPNLAWWANGDGYITWYNRRWYEYTGTTSERMEGWGWQSVHDPEVLPSVMERWQASIATGRPFDMVFPLRGSDGVYRPFLTRVMPISDQDGKVIRWFGTNTDISEQQRTEEDLKQAHRELAHQMEQRTRELHEKEVLLKEIHHRVKNNLQVISSLVNLQADGSKDETVREVLREVTFRVRSMALVHEKLYQTESLALIDFGEYAKTLVHHLWKAHGSIACSIRLTFDLEPVSLSVDTAVPCGLILNELASNALKHAFRGRDTGEVTVSLRVTPERCVTLGLHDNGIGLPPELDWRKASSLGLRLVHMLSGQLNATVQAQQNGGSSFRITFPLPDSAQDPPKSPVTCGSSAPPN